MKGILFDFNGTMVFDGWLHDLAWKQVALELRGSEMSDEEIAMHVHGHINEQIIAYLKPDITNEENKRLSIKKEQIYRELCQKHKECYCMPEGLEELLDKLKENGILMNIASASISENIDFFISFFDLDRWFDVCKIRYDDGSYQDKKQMFLDAAKEIGCDIEECCIFEDSFGGIDCAKKIGAGKIIAISDDEIKRECYLEDDEIAMVIENYKNIKMEDIL